MSELDINVGRIEQLAEVFGGSVVIVEERDEWNVSISDEYDTTLYEIVYKRDEGLLSVNVNGLMVTYMEAPVEDWQIRQTVDDSQLYTELEYCGVDGEVEGGIGLWGPEAKMGPDGDIEFVEYTEQNTFAEEQYLIE